MSFLADAFAELRSALERAGVRYAIGGSWACNAFGEHRFTNDVDILADFTVENLHRFLHNLPATFYVYEEEAVKALRAGPPFHVLYMPTALKFDFFPAVAYPLGDQELERAISLSATGLSEGTGSFRYARRNPACQTALVQVGRGLIENPVARHRRYHSRVRRDSRSQVSRTERRKAKCV